VHFLPILDVQKKGNGIIFGCMELDDMAKEKEKENGGI
jgi:hypothetical protein